MSGAKTRHRSLGIQALLFATRAAWKTHASLPAGLQMWLIMRVGAAKQQPKTYEQNEEHEVRVLRIGLEEQIVTRGKWQHLDW